MTNVQPIRNEGREPFDDVVYDEDGKPLEGPTLEEQIRRLEEQ